MPILSPWVRSELSNLYYFFFAILKAGLITGFWFGLGAVVWADRSDMLRQRTRRSAGGLKIRKVYRVEGYSLGDFIGELLAIDLDLARVRVVDSLRPAPRVKNRCCFPKCIREDFHEGDHEFPTIRADATVQVPWKLANWVPVEERPAA